MSNSIPRLLIFAVLTVGFNSCQLAGKVLFGIRSNVNWMEPEEIHSYFDKYDIPENQRYVLDTASYYNAEVLEYQKRIETSDSTQKMLYRKIVNDNLQMFQIRFFDGDGQPIFKMVNCYIDPPLPVSWNKHGSFDEFPPSIDFMHSGDGNKPLAHFLQHIHTLDQKSIAQKNLPESDYFAVVFVNDLMTRVGRRQMRTVTRYLKKHEDKNIHAFFVHNNNAEMWQLVKQNGIAPEEVSISE